MEIPREFVFGFGGVFFEQTRFPCGELARFGVHEAKRADGLSIGCMQRDTDREAQTVFTAKRIVREAPVTGEIFNGDDFVFRNDVDGDGDIALRLARRGKAVGQSTLAEEKLPMALNDRDEREGHLEDAREFGGETVE